MMKLVVLCTSLFISGILAYNLENDGEFTKSVNVHKRIPMSDLFTIIGEVNKYVSKQIKENNKKLLEDDIPKIIKTTLKDYITKLVTKTMKDDMSKLIKKTLKDDVTKLIKKMLRGQKCLSKSACTGDWKKYRNHCYKFVKDKVDWTTAKSRCEAEGSSLVKINDRAENNWIFKAGGVSSTRVKGETHLEVYWTGGKYNNKTWKWLDNSRFSFTYWRHGEPNTRQEECVNIGWTGAWNDMGCQRGLYYICERTL